MSKKLATQYKVYLQSYAVDEVTIEIFRTVPHYGQVGSVTYSWCMRSVDEEEEQELRASDRLVGDINQDGEGFILDEESRIGFVPEEIKSQAVRRLIADQIKSCFKFKIVI